MRKGMEYLVLTAQKGNPAPRTDGWYGKLDVKKLCRETFRELPEYVLLNMKTGMDVFYPDILFAPFLLVSREAMEVIRIYEEEMPFLYVAMVDTQSGESCSYYCPVLAEGIACGEALYRVKKGNEWEVRIRVDLAESLLLRGAEGMEFAPLEEENNRGNVRKSIWG